MANQLRRYVDALHHEFGDGEPIRGIFVVSSVTERADGILDHKGLKFVAPGPETDEPPVEEDEGEVEKSEKVGSTDADA